jgi:hypothetical protein
MTRFLDCRISAVGGELATAVAVNQGTSLGNYGGLAMAELQGAIQGRNVLIATHGFNVNRADGIACLSNWEINNLQLPAGSAFVGLLWPGDSVWAHGLDYPGEPKVADEAGALLGPYLDQYFSGASSISFASHSLGARVVLATIRNMNSAVRRLILMAGAVDDDALTNEFADAAASVGEISVLASKKDEVLSLAFPMGNFFSGIIAVGHPWWRAALGHSGPTTPFPDNFQTPYAIPENWNYQHGDYLHVDVPAAKGLPIPTDIPPNGSPVAAEDVNPDGAYVAGWTEAFSAAVASTRFR